MFDMLLCEMLIAHINFIRTGYIYKRFPSDMVLLFTICSMQFFSVGLLRLFGAAAISWCNESKMRVADYSLEEA